MKIDLNDKLFKVLTTALIAVCLAFYTFFFANEKSENNRAAKNVAEILTDVHSGAIPDIESGHKEFNALLQKSYPVGFPATQLVADLNAIKWTSEGTRPEDVPQTLGVRKMNAPCQSKAHAIGAIYQETTGIYVIWCTNTKGEISWIAGDFSKGSFT